MESHSYEEKAAASAVASLKLYNSNPDAAAGPDIKKLKSGMVAQTVQRSTQRSRTNTQAEERALQPAPFFYYKNFSKEEDKDPLMPLTFPGHVPNFVAKLHSILSRPELSDVVAWLPHGRSWRVLKPREFEIRVIPTYFEHAKFSSFIRQANGWGFRRITQGPDRNSYYHEQFLRGLPHLCKTMKRPRVTEKKATDVEHEPDFYKISDMYPVPQAGDAEKATQQVDCTLQGGPKARMPILCPTIQLHSSTSKMNGSKQQASMTSNLNTSLKLSPQDQLKVGAFQQSITASEGPSGVSSRASSTPQLNGGLDSMAVPPFFSFSNRSTPLNASFANNAAQQNNMSALAAAKQLAFMPSTQMTAMNSSPYAAVSPSSNTFAAGFAAGSLLSQQQLQSIFFQHLSKNVSHQQSMYPKFP